MGLGTPISRRGVIGGLGAAGLATAVGVRPVGAAEGDRPGPTDGPDAGPSIQQLFEASDLANPIVQTLSAYDFRPIEDSAGLTSTYVSPGGVRFTAGFSWFVAGLRLPVGAIITGAQVFLNPTGTAGVAELARYRPLTPVKEVLAAQSSTAGAAVEAVTLPLTHAVDPAWNYILLSPLMSSSGPILYGGAVTYTVPPDPPFPEIPPPAAPPVGLFVPFAGANPRVYDSRSGGGQLAANEERVIPLGVPGTIQAAMFNLTVTETQAAGFVSCFRADIAWPGNSSVNWSQSGASVANLVVCAVDASGQIKIRGGDNSTHVVIDLIGTFV